MESKIKELLHQYEMDSNYPKLRTALLSLSLPPSKEVVSDEEIEDVLFEFDSLAISLEEAIKQIRALFVSRLSNVKEGLCDCKHVECVGAKNCAKSFNHYGSIIPKTDSKLCEKIEESRNSPETKGEIERLKGIITELHQYKSEVLDNAVTITNQKSLLTKKDKEIEALRVELINKNDYLPSEVNDLLNPSN